MDCSMFSRCSGGKTMNQQPRHMLIFSLGPVQPFIAQARKTRDLWLGSFILSTLMAAGTKGITGTFVFPTKREIKEHIPDIPNKYIALFHEPENARPAAEQSESL